MRALIIDHSLAICGDPLLWPFIISPCQHIVRPSTSLGFQNQNTSIYIPLTSQACRDCILMTIEMWVPKQPSTVTCCTLIHHRSIDFEPVSSLITNRSKKTRCPVCRVPMEVAHFNHSVAHSNKLLYELPGTLLPLPALPQPPLDTIWPWMVLDDLLSVRPATLADRPAPQGNLLLPRGQRNSPPAHPRHRALLQPRRRITNHQPAASGQAIPQATSRADGDDTPGSRPSQAIVVSDNDNDDDDDDSDWSPEPRRPSRVKRARRRRS